jgi:tellurite resistance protein
MIATSAVDRSMSTEELARIGTMVSQLPMFDRFDANADLVDVSRACSRVLAGDNGLKTLLAIIGGSLEGPLRETAYMLALEVAAVDMTVSAEETRFLELLARTFELDKLTIAALERGAKARHQRL